MIHVSAAHVLGHLPETSRGLFVPDQTVLGEVILAGSTHQIHGITLDHSAGSSHLESLSERGDEEVDLSNVTVEIISTIASHACEHSAVLGHDLQCGVSLKFSAIQDQLNDFARIKLAE